MINSFQSLQLKVLSSSKLGFNIFTLNKKYGTQLLAKNSKKITRPFLQIIWLYSTN